MGYVEWTHLVPEMPSQYKIMITIEAYEEARKGGYIDLFLKDAPATPNWLVTNWYRVALTPAFFQALGKALGWPKYKDTVIARDGAVETVRSENEVWFDIAHRLYSLILEGKDTAEFWAELLNK